MDAKKVALSALIVLFLLTSAFSQNVELTGYVGGQLNGGLDLSTSLFRRIEVENSMNYGLSAGYLVGEHYGVEFQWNHSKADTLAQPAGGGSDIKVFALNQDQYMGNFLFHFTDREAKLRPFAFFGLGLATSRRTGAASIRRHVSHFLWVAAQNTTSANTSPCAGRPNGRQPTSQQPMGDIGVIRFGAGAGWSETITTCTSSILLAESLFDSNHTQSSTAPARLHDGDGSREA